MKDKYYIETRETKKGITTVRKPYLPDEFKLRKIKHALLLDAQIQNGSSADEPFIIRGYKSDLKFDRTKQVVFKNGVLNVKINEFTSLKPELYITSTLPFWF